MKHTVHFSMTLDDDETEVDVEAVVIHTPGRLYGPPEDCYSDETEIEILSVRGENGAKVELTDAEYERAEGIALEVLTREGAL